jgi:serine/threonine-protein kinase
MRNDYAWMLATAPEDDLRDGPTALRVIRSAIEELGEDDPAYMDTLAAALAENGEFAEAVRVQQKAVAGLSAALAPAPVVAGAQSRLDGYRLGKPARQTAAP